MKKFVVSSCFILIRQCFVSTAAIDWFPREFFPSVAPHTSSNDDSDYLDENLGEARIFFNTTGTYNATTLATWSGAALFIALNSIFIMTFLTPKASKKEADQEYEYYDEDSSSNLNYDEVVKKQRRYVRSSCYDMFMTCHIKNQKCDTICDMSMSLYLLLHELLSILQ